MTNKVYIIILNYNGWKDTIECLESVLKSDYNNYQVIVIDNASPNNSMDYIINWAEGKQDIIYDEHSQLKYLSQPFEEKPLDYVFYSKEEALNGGDKEKESKLDNPIIFIQAGENGGFAAGNNIGMKYALKKDDFEYIWLLNNDTVIEKDSLNELILGHNNLKNIGILGSKMIYYFEPNILQGIGATYNKYLGSVKTIGNHTRNNGQFDSLKQKIDFVIGASMFVSKKYLKDVGLLCEEYFLYYEELDWTLRGEKFNYITKCATRSLIYHKEGSSIGSSHNSNKKSLFSDFWHLKNKKIFTNKFYPSLKLSIFMSYILIILNRLRRSDFKAAWQAFELMFDLKSNVNDEIKCIRQIKIVIISLHNILYLIIPFFKFKNIYLNILRNKIDKSSSIHSPVKFYSISNITLGENSVINSGCELDNRNKIIIGKNVSISHGVKIFTLGHDVQDAMFSTKGDNVVIEDYVVIFSGAMIMPGITISEGAVIYPGSIVTKNVEAYTIVGGNPAKKIATRNNNLKYTIDYNYWFAT